MAVPKSPAATVGTTATLAASQAALVADAAPTATIDENAKPKRSTRRKKANTDA